MLNFSCHELSLNCLFKARLISVVINFGCHELSLNCSFNAGLTNVWINFGDEKLKTVVKLFI